MRGSKLKKTAAIPPFQKCFHVRFVVSRVFCFHGWIFPADQASVNGDPPTPAHPRALAAKFKQQHQEEDVMQIKPELLGLLLSSINRWENTSPEPKGKMKT